MERRSVLATVAFIAGIVSVGAVPVIAQELPAAAPAGPARWSLGDVVSAAISNHPRVGQADAAARASAERAGQVASVRYPQVGASAGFTWAEARSAATGEYDQSTASTAQGTVSQLVTDFGRTKAAVARSEDLLAAAGESARWERVEAAYAAGIAYFNVLRAETVLAVSRETVRQRETLQRQAQAFFDAGLRARIDFVRAEANLYQARADATSAGLEVQTARRLLLAAMGLDGPADFELLGAPAGVEAAGTIEEWQREADAKHPDLQALRLRVNAARNDVLAAGRGSNPTISASGRLGFAGEDVPSDRAWAVGAQVSVPLLNGGLTRHQEGEATANLAAAEFALAERRRQVRLVVEQAGQAMEEAKERLGAREKEREAFAENLRLATGRYEAGAADIIEMVDAQVQMTAAETSFVQARFDRAVALLTLYRALGRLPAAEPR